MTVPVYSSYYEPVYAEYDAHEEWCLNRYRSYDPASDTWVGYSGKVYRCRSPYSG